MIIAYTTFEYRSEFQEYLDYADKNKDNLDLINKLFKTSKIASRCLLYLSAIYSPFDISNDY